MTKSLSPLPDEKKAFTFTLITQKGHSMCSESLSGKPQKQDATRSPGLCTTLPHSSTQQAQKACTQPAQWPPEVVEAEKGARH